MKEKLKNNKLLIIIAVIVLLMALSVLGIWLSVSKFNDGTNNGKKEYLTREVFYEKLEDLGNPNNDVGVMIMDCDNMDTFKESLYTQITRRTGKYVQGTGAIVNTKFQTELMRGVLAKAVDISDYKKGSIHLSLYVADMGALTDAIYLELGSAGLADADELQWVLPLSKMESGWNEFYLKLSGGVSTGNPDLAAINYFRVYSPNPTMGVKVILDNVYASETEGVIYEPDPVALPAVVPDAYKETDAPNGKMIASCNTVNIFSGLLNVEVTTKTGEFVEGTGAFKTVGFQNSLGEGLLAKSVDISEYKDGYVHLSLYVNDVSRLRKPIQFELTSGSTCDVNEYEWSIAINQLENGWNELYLPFSTAYVTGSPNLNVINYLRLYTLEQKEGLVTIFDNIYATSKGATDSAVETESPYGKMIMSCNTINIFSILDHMKVTNTPNEYVEGTGALKSTDNEYFLGRGVFANPVDISAYEKGYVHLSLFVNDTSNLKNCVNFELSSSGKSDVDEYEWFIDVSELKNGWNEISLHFSKADVVTGKPSLKKINFFRIFSADCSKDLIVILDNVYAATGKTDTTEDPTNSEETKSPYGKMIMSCNTEDVFKWLSVMKLTQKEGEFVEGTGAFKTVDAEVVLGEGVFANAVDIHTYVNGYVHLALYVNDTSLLTNGIQFELSSGGVCDVNEYEWSIKKASLKNGWNDVYLPFSTAFVTGTPDLKEIDFIRMYSLEQKSGLITILDNVYATNSKDTGFELECDEVLKTGDILPANCTCYFSSYSNMKLTTTCKNGYYALKAKKVTSDISGTFKKSVDISAYKNGGVHIWLYINDNNKLENNVIFRLSSGGAGNKDVYAWTIKKNTLSSGWNELWLSFAEAKVTGSPNLAGINYFSMGTDKPDSKLEMILDDVYAYLK